MEPSWVVEINCLFSPVSLFAQNNCSRLMDQITEEVLYVAVFLSKFVNNSPYRSNSSSALSLLPLFSPLLHFFANFYLLVIRELTYRSSDASSDLSQFKKH